MAKLENEVSTILVHVLRSEDTTNIVKNKTFKGKPVKALMVSIVRTSLKCGNPSRVLADAINETIAKNEKLRKMAEKVFDATYTRENLKWSENDVWGGEGTFFPKFKECWNKAGGDPEKCSELIGKNDWAEDILSPADCMKQYNNAVKEMKEHGLTNMIESAQKRKGRAKIDMSAVADSILKELSALSA